MDRITSTEMPSKTRLVLIAALSSLALTGCSDKQPINTSEQVCSNDLGAEPGMVTVDGRCDANPSSPVGIYTEPSQDSAAFAKATTGNGLYAVCLIEGESIRDLSGVTSTKWVEIDFARSMDSLDLIDKGVNLGDGPLYIPSVWVDGEEKLDKCT